MSHWKDRECNYSINGSSKGSADIASKIVQLAKEYIGQTEKSGNMGFNNADFERKMEEVGFQKTHAWCAYFCELVWTEALRLLNKPLLAEDMADTFSASATKTYDNFKDYPLTKISKDPVPGALAVWRQGRGWKGHIGIVVEVKGDYFISVEGNTNDKGGREGYIVAEKTRGIAFTDHPSALNLIGFVHPMI